VFAQVAFVAQPPLFVAHSSTSVHAVPLPVKPVLQVQTTLPELPSHVALGLHPPLLLEQSGPPPVSGLPASGVGVDPESTFTPPSDVSPDSVGVLEPHATPTRSRDGSSA